MSLCNPTRPVVIMRVLLTVLFLLIAHKGTYAKPKPKPKPFFGGPHWDYGLNGRLDKSKFSYCKFV